MSADRINLNALLNEALTQWVAVTGVNPKQTSFGLSGHEFDAYHLHQTTKEFEASRDLDPSGLTTFMMMRNTVRSFLHAQTVSTFLLVTEGDAVIESVKPAKALWTLLNDPDALAEIESFREIILGACEHYGIEPDDDFKAWLDGEGLAVLRRDAMRSLETLTLHQFSQGQSDSKTLRYNQKVVEFWNMNSLLSALRSQRLPGMTLVLIRDPLAMFSFFCIAVRDGDTISVLTDAPKTPHPDFKKMSRRPDRALSKRAEQHWFPYELLDLKSDEDSDRLYAQARTALVPVNAEAIALKDVKDLNPATVIWLTLLMELLREKLQVKGHHTPELSYTGEMIRTPNALVAANSALVREGFYKPIDLPPITKADMQSTEAVKEAAGFSRESTGFNDWMIDRYGDKVPEVAFNVIGEREVTAALTSIETGDLSPIDDGRGFMTREVSHLPIAHMDPLAFGTKKEISQDRVWAARKNQSIVIQRLAEEEFIRERENVLRWYAEHLNIPMLLNAAARETLIGPHFRARRMVLWAPLRETHTTDESYAKAVAEYERDRVDNMSEQQMLTQKSDPNHFGIMGSDVFLCEAETWIPGVIKGQFQLRALHSQRTPDRHVDIMCYERPETKANVLTQVRPTCPEAIAFLCGVTVAELPWPLQHWYSDNPYHGNSILDRLDHADWVLHNPWMANDYYRSGVQRDRLHIPPLTLRIGFAQCRSAVNARRKLLDLPKKDWPEPPPKRKPRF